ncbi:hypothetical protein P691DRAFT_763470 [Macrolepiota fuliginosa MF-IS2]|uniref:Uncharacterized protein n=1 Tax=Macrolepiota fuliginosa MF-IS2 TaxID=1400762 RepID=A0A9P5X4D7_9AGAR|nr:hypothetical protein P691DRAFT_763470 [Macrolepiota fuliginosa MF-IS2]
MTQAYENGDKDTSIIVAQYVNYNYEFARRQTSTLAAKEQKADPELLSCSSAREVMDKHIRDKFREEKAELERSLCEVGVERDRLMCENADLRAELEDAKNRISDLEERFQKTNGRVGKKEEQDTPLPVAHLHTGGLPSRPTKSANTPTITRHAGVVEFDSDFEVEDPSYTSHLISTISRKRKTSDSALSNSQKKPTARKRHFDYDSDSDALLSYTNPEPELAQECGRATTGEDNIGSSSGTKHKKHALPPSKSRMLTPVRRVSSERHGVQMYLRRSRGEAAHRAG